MAEWYDKYNSIGDIQVGARPGTAPQAKAKKKKEKGFLLDQISTGGGIGGSLAGAAGGAAIGSVVPVVGTAVGGLIGAILGGAAGSAGGELAENAITGDDLMKNVGSEALLGGLTSTPIGAGFKLAKAGVKATTGIGKQSAADLVQQAGVQTVGKKTATKYGLNPTAPTAAAGEALETSASGRLKNAGNKALLSQYGTISKPFARSTDPAKTISTLADAGITKPVDAERVANGITGSGGILTRATSDAVGGAGGVDTSTLRKVFNDSLDNYGIVDTDRKSLQKVFDAQMNKLSGGARGSLSPTVNSTDALEMMRSLEKRVANLRGKGDNYRLSTPERMDQASVLNLVRDELEDSLYRGAGANAQLSNVLTPQLREEALALMPNNAQWAKYVDDNIMGAKSVGDVRSAAAPFVRAGKIIDEGEQNAITFGGRVGNAFQGGGITSMIGEAATNLLKNPAANIAGQSLRAASGVAGRAAPAVAGQSVGALTARQAIPRMLLGGQGEAEALDPMTLEGALAGGDLGAQQAPQQEQPMNPTGYSSTELAQALMKALAANDNASAAQLQQMYELASQFEQEQSNSLSANQQTSLATSGNAINTLDQLESLFGGAGGGSGKIGGAFANLTAGAGLNDGVQTYNNLAESSVSQLAKAINGGGQVSDADAAVLVKALPQVTDSPQVARAKFEALRQRLVTAQQNTLAFGGGQGSSLESVLAGIQ